MGASSPHVGPFLARLHQQSTPWVAGERWEHHFQGCHAPSPLGAGGQLSPCFWAINLLKSSSGSRFVLPSLLGPCQAHAASSPAFPKTERGALSIPTLLDLVMF